MAAAALTACRSCTHFDVPTDALGPARFHSTLLSRTAGWRIEAAFVARLVNELEQLIEREGADTIAAFIAEPIGGAAGVVVAPDSHPAVREVLKKHDILFWADEVICGFGRTGNDFGSNTMGINLI